jgi:hypothetical protein
MQDTLHFFAVMSAITVLVEFAVLRRCLGRRSYSFCILSVSLLSGVVWLASMRTLFGIRWGRNAADALPLSGSEWMVFSLCVVLGVLFFSAVALIPAGGVALIYRRWRNGHEGMG